MAQDYVLINNSAAIGIIAINKSVFRCIAELSIDEIDNAVRIPETKFNHPIALKIEDNKLKVSSDIRIRYGANVSQTGELVQNKIYENIYYMTGFKASDVTVNVTGFDI